MQQEPLGSDPLHTGAGVGATVQNPRVAIVIPLFKHSSLILEALDSALDQHAEFGIVTIIVNDGCPFRESREVCRDFALAYPGRVLCLEKPNGGLSSARNAGINLVMADLPTVEAIYFLDADNRLSSTAMAMAMQVLERNSRTDWVYPNIDMFGLREAWDYVGEYSVIRNLNENICEAGSLVHRRVFEAGLRFDETMLSGYEDWDFWLSAAEKGFRGTCLGTFGFEYRRRPESMVTGSHRQDHAIRSYMRRKHKSLLSTARLLQEEQVSHPRYAIHYCDSDRILAATDARLALSQPLSLDAFERLCWKAISEPARTEVPGFVLSTTSQGLDLLKRLGLLPWALWCLEERLAEAHVACLSVEIAEYGAQVGVVDATSQGPIDRSRSWVMAMMPRSLLNSCAQDKSTTWFDSLMAERPQPKFVHIQLKLPNEHAIKNRLTAVASSPNAVFAGLQRIVHRLHHSRFKPTSSESWSWRNIPPGRVQPAFAVVRQLAEINAPLLPLVPSKGTFGSVAFALPYVSFGGVEKVAINMAGELRRRGYSPHLVITDTRSSELPQIVRQNFETISFLCEDDINRWNPQSTYLGTATSDWSRGGSSRQIQRALGLLSGFDVLINAHCKDLNAVIGELRRRGVRTISHQHVVDLNKFGRPGGHPYLTLAYEHGYEAIVCCSNMMRAWLAGMGVPSDKLIVVENAPGMSLAASRLDAALLDRAGRARQNLRILVLGRLDRQKGLDRVAALYEKALRADFRCDWRIVGTQVVANEATKAALPAEIYSPSVNAPEALADLYAWADVLLLLSDWEGLPLTILEAMPFGCLPVATNVGAVHEAVTDGETGFLLDLDQAVDDAFKRLVQLHADRRRLARMAQAASRAGRQRSWHQSIEPLVAQLERWGFPQSGTAAA